MTDCLVLGSFIGEMLAGKTARVVFRVGDGALEANIRKLFDIEGGEDLATETFSADAVEVNAAAAEGGRVKNHMGACRVLFVVVICFVLRDIGFRGA